MFRVAKSRRSLKIRVAGHMERGEPAAWGAVTRYLPLLTHYKSYAAIASAAGI